MELPRSPALIDHASALGVFGLLAGRPCARKVCLFPSKATPVDALVSATLSIHGNRGHPSVPHLLLLSPTLLIHSLECLPFPDFQGMSLPPSRFLPAPPARPWWVARCRPFQHLGDLKRVMGSRSGQTVHAMSWPGR